MNYVKHMQDRLAAELPAVPFEELVPAVNADDYLLPSDYAIAGMKKRYPDKP